MIGIFDSGSGGLSVLSAIRERLPLADILYLGDIKNAPYGEKSQEQLLNLTARSIRFLQAHGAQNVVSACNSVSASLATSLFKEFDFSGDKVIEMVEPTVNSFRDSDERVLLCATSATISSGIYQSGFHMLKKDINTIAIPKLAGAIEFGASEKEIEQIITHAFTKVQLEVFDVLVLGCTHYPLVTHIFTKVLGNSIHIINPALAVAKCVEERFSPHEAQINTIHFYITNESKQFRDRVAMLFPKSTNTIEVLK